MILWSPCSVNGSARDNVTVPPACSLSSSLLLAEKATNPKNKYEDWEFIMAFCDRVNADLEG